MNKILLIMSTLLLFFSNRLLAYSTPHLRTKARIVSIETAVKIFKIKIGRLPTQEEGLQALMKKPEDPEEQKFWSGPYFKQLPKDSWNNDFIYIVVQESEKGFEIFSLGPDGKSSSKGNDWDDINSWSSTSGPVSIHPNIFWIGLISLIVVIFVVRGICNRKAKRQEEIEE